MTQAAIAISGTTRIFGMFGDPIAQAKAPGPVSRMLADGGVDAVLVPLHVPVGHVSATFAALKAVPNFGGALITIPHKVAMAQLVDRLSERARLTQSCNICARRADGLWEGDILDGYAFAESLLHHDYDPNGKAALIIGAGGAGSAVAAELAMRGARVSIYDSDGPRAAALAERLRQAGYSAQAADVPVPVAHDMIVNASPTGMAGDPNSPVDPGLLTPDMRVAEFIMEPRETPLLRAAAAKGCAVSYGADVMDFQLDLIVDFFTRTDS